MKQTIENKAVIVERPSAVRPAPSKPLVSFVLPTPEAVAAAYAPINGNGHHKPTAKAVEAMQEVAGPVASSFKVQGAATGRTKSKKPNFVEVEKSAPVVVAPKPEAHPYHATLTKAKFQFVKAQGTALGYQNEDGRAALVNGDSWMFATVGGGKATGETLKELKEALLKPTVAANVVKTVAALGGYTLQRFRLDLLDGDKKYAARVKLLKALRKTDKVLVKSSTLAVLRKELYAAVGAKTEPEFIAKCKAIGVSDRTIKKAAKADETELIDRAKRATLAERTPTGPGVTPILDVEPRMTNKQRLAKSAADRDQLKLDLATPKPVVPHDPRATFTRPLAPSVKLASVEGQEERAQGSLSPTHHRAEDIVLLEHTMTGLVILRLERPNSQGAISVYNNGNRVACGLVTTETLSHFRKIEGADVPTAARELLHPIVAGVEVTPVAERHLTEILKNKELIAMAAITEKKTPKFAAPVKKETTAKAEKTTKTTKPAKASKDPGAERKSSLFRLKNDTKSTWSAFTGQKGDIIAGLVKLGAVGAKAAGVTRAAILAALPNIGPNNVSFYLSKWQEPGIVEKLAAAE